jgi:hypothetical protein
MVIATAQVITPAAIPRRRGERRSDSDRAQLDEHDPQRKPAADPAVTDGETDGEPEQHEDGLQRQGNKDTGCDRTPAGGADQPRALLELARIHDPRERADAMPGSTA